ncbi:MAG: DNA-binding response regulator [Rhodospirillales bacterium]|jgi:DNA-binding NarL/FixJ family response regulator|nr:DNA-binding response regulator [Rhodospirillales bacterium]
MRLLLIEDHAMIRQGLGLLLRQLYPEIVVREASTATEGLQLLGSEEPFDVILLDFYLPDASGGAMVQDYVSRSGAPVVILSGSNNPQDISAAMKAGAKGYIVKSSKPATLHHVLELTLAGESFFPWEGTNSEPAAPARVPVDGGDFSPGETPDLTDRQKQILKLVAQGKSNKEIARALDILEGTVKAHLRFLMKHLNAKNRTQLAVMASKLP